MEVGYFLAWGSVSCLIRPDFFKREGGVKFGFGFELVLGLVFGALSFVKECAVGIMVVRVRMYLATNVVQHIIVGLDGLL